MPPLALPTGGLVMEGRGVGRGCTALMSHGGSKGRALPRAWRVRQAPPGPLPAALPLALGTRSSALLPTGAPGVWRGAGACDGTQRQQPRQQAGWASACRPATRPVATWAGEPCRLEALGACRKPGRLREFKEVHYTREASGPILGLWCWAKG